jgi:curved DNA-binding protein CbpA
MKDFYKILGVKENASEEEIRERWIELTKHYHPDRGVDIASEEKIREINEAYQVLKHSSTRVEYDLNRTYGPQKREEKRESYFKKLSVPASILILVIIIGVIYIKNYQSPPPSEPIVSNQINQRNEINQINQTNQINQRNQTNQINQIDQRNQINQRNQRDVPPQQLQVVAVTPAVPIINPTNATILTNKTIPTDSTNAKNSIDAKTQRPKDVISPITPSIAMAATMEKIQLTQPSQTLITQLPNDLIVNRPTDSTISTNITIRTNPTNPIDSKIELAQFKPPSFLATEDEVKKFFDNYIERYNRMDIEGFLSLFSPKAIQNQKDRLEGIRKIYIDFFNQGEKVRYRIQDMKIEIYQNALEVKGRYEIVQILKTGGGERVWRGNIRWVLGKENGALKILSLDYQYQ